MECANKLALVAIVTGLRQSGIIDKRAVKSIVEMMQSMALLSRPHCTDTADDLMALAAMMEDGPMRSCLPSTPQGAFDRSPAVALPQMA